MLKASIGQHRLGLGRIGHGVATKTNTGWPAAALRYAIITASSHRQAKKGSPDQSAKKLSIAKA